MAEFLHERRDFNQLLVVVADQRNVDPMLVEKDYWLMHSLWGLQAQGFVFELKGGTSLSKGFGVIHRFSEDIDIRIEPPEGMDVKTGQRSSIFCRAQAVLRVCAFAMPLAVMQKSEKFHHQ
jgi:hypothetical protein